MRNDIPEFKYYNLCLPREMLDTAKAIAARKGITLKEHITRIILESNEKEGGNYAGRSYGPYA